MALMKDSQESRHLDISASCKGAKRTADSLSFFLIGLKVSVHSELTWLINRNITLYPKQPPQPSDLCTICYTSGTTGNPKGVMLSHENIVADVSATLLQLGDQKPNCSDVMMSFLPLAHMLERVCEVSVYMQGGCVGFFSGDVRNLMDDMKALRPTITPAVPRLLNRSPSSPSPFIQSLSILEWWRQMNSSPFRIKSIFWSPTAACHVTFISFLFSLGFYLFSCFHMFSYVFICFYVLFLFDFFVEFSTRCRAGLASHRWSGSCSMRRSAPKKTNYGEASSATIPSGTSWCWVKSRRAWADASASLSSDRPRWQDPCWRSCGAPSAVSSSKDTDRLNASLPPHLPSRYDPILIATARRQITRLDYCSNCSNCSNCSIHLQAK